MSRPLVPLLSTGFVGGVGGVGVSARPFAAPDGLIRGAGRRTVPSMSRTATGAPSPSSVPQSELAALTAATRERRRAVDPLLPDPSPTDPGDPALAVHGDDGRLVAIGTCRRTQPAPDSIELTWGREDQHRLSSVRVGGENPARAMDWLLTAWCDELAGLDEPVWPDSAAIVTVPSRDAAEVPALLAHGLQPLSVVASRPAGRSATGGSSNEVRVRPARPADHQVVTALHLEEVRYDARFGSVTERPHTETRIDEMVRTLLDDPDPWIWLAEHDGHPAGIAIVSPPWRAGWIAPLVAAEPVAYIDCLSVAASERGGGIGATLIDHVHRHIDDAGIAVTLLHYGTVNPLSGPFWSRMGYRPLWTSWQACPATALR